MRECGGGRGEVLAEHCLVKEGGVRGHAVSWCAERRGCGSCVHTAAAPPFVACFAAGLHTYARVPALPVAVWLPRVCLGALRACAGAAAGRQLPQTHLVIDKHLTDLPLYLAGHLGNTPGVCL